MTETEIVMIAEEFKVVASDHNGGVGYVENLTGNFIRVSFFDFGDFIGRIDIAPHDYMILLENDNGYEYLESARYGNCYCDFLEN